ncbi:vesicle-associated membrane protein 711 [Cajanus cajan]|uniref:vesicle-associated membrane protein 711 n=1 Tax=Cajanus cajan TaxID=3821 RepID=UPI00098DA49E|nr:vesicle-associated membrane protein 711 [Cajanus cajan]
MGILYAMVARGQIVLAEFNASQSNASSVAKQILSKINQGSDNNDDSNVSFSHDRYVFHVKRTDGLTVLCMADDAFGRMVPFAFLEDIHKKFVKTYGRAILSAPAYAMNDEFSRVLNQQMDYYSNDPNADRLNRLKGEMTQVRTVMIDNIEKVLERGGRLEMLVEKTSAMNSNSIRFKRQSRRYKNNMWWSNVRLMVALIITSVVVIYIILAFICHGPLLTSCWR